MTELYVLLGNGGYDGLDVLGVYASKEDARLAAREYEFAYDHGYEGFVVETRQVGAPAKDGFLEPFREHLVLDEMKVVDISVKSLYNVLYIH